MTINEAEQWIRKLEGGNEYDMYRPSSNLSIVLRLMLHSHLKQAFICRMTVHDYLHKTFEVAPLDDEFIQTHIRKNHLQDTDYLITVSSRALRYKFQNVVKVYNTDNQRIEIGDFFYAGLGRENKSMNRY